ncbi:hypothetical protein ACHAXT_001113 [Thalassiosira profunda]
MKKQYCALGFGRNFFYELGSDAVPIPPNLLPADEGESSDSSDNEGGNNANTEGKDGAYSDRAGGAQVNLLCINPSAISMCTESRREFASAGEWVRAYLPSERGEKGTPYSSKVKPLISCGATHTSLVLPSSSSSSSGTGEANLVGTIFGHAYPSLTVQPTRLPLKIKRISSGRRHVLALTEGASPGGGVVMSWGAGHFGQLGHGPDLTSCLEPRIVERLLPHVCGGNVIEIAAGGLHSAAIVAPESDNIKAFAPNGDSKSTIIVRETRTFAWGSNRKGQCAVEGGKCATVPEPLPVMNVKRGETPKRGGEKDGGKTDPIDKSVHFEKLSLGRLHTVALTAYGEVFTWGSTSMGRCGHSPSDSGRSGERRFTQQPRHVGALRNVVIEGIAAGAAHTLALSKGGRVFAFGAGVDGQCGQGHAGNLFSPRAVQGLPTSSPVIESESSLNKKMPSIKHLSKHTKGKFADEEGHMPHVNSKVAMEVSMEEEELSKALTMNQNIGGASNSKRGPKPDKIVAIRAAGSYSAAVTSHGELYTWGYGSGAAIGHPIPSEAEGDLPLIPIIEGNQYSTSTAAKVYPEGGSDDNKIRDCRCFDTDLNVMWPRRVECTDALGLRVEDVSLGPGHMVMLCSVRDNSDGSDASHEGPTGLPLHNITDDSQGSETGGSRSSTAGEEKLGASGSMQGSGLLQDAKEGGEELNDIVANQTFESNDSSTRSAEKKVRSPGWMKRMKSSRSSKDGSNKSLGSSEKKKSLRNMLRLGGDK